MWIGSYVEALVPARAAMVVSREIGPALVRVGFLGDARRPRRRALGADALEKCLARVGGGRVRQTRIEKELTDPSWRSLPRLIGVFSEMLHAAANAASTKTAPRTTRRTRD